MSFIPDLVRNRIDSVVRRMVRQGECPVLMSSDFFRENAVQLYEELLLTPGEVLALIAKATAKATSELRST